MKTIDDMPPAHRHKWDEIAELLQNGSALLFTKGEDYEDVNSFRSILYTSMKSRNVQVRTVARNQGAELCVAKKD